MSALRGFSTAERLMILAAVAALLLVSRWPAAGAETGPDKAGAVDTESVQRYIVQVRASYDGAESLMKARAAGQPPGTGNLVDLIAAPPRAGKDPDRVWLTMVKSGKAVPLH